MFETKSEPVSFLVYLKPQCTEEEWWSTGVPCCHLPHDLVQPYTSYKREVYQATKVQTLGYMGTPSPSRMNICKKTTGVFLQCFLWLHSTFCILKFRFRGDMKHLMARASKNVTDRISQVWNHVKSCPIMSPGCTMVSTECTGCLTTLDTQTFG